MFTQAHTSIVVLYIIKYSVTHNVSLAHKFCHVCIYKTLCITNTPPSFWRKGRLQFIGSLVVVVFACVVIYYIYAAVKLCTSECAFMYNVHLYDIFDRVYVLCMHIVQWCGRTRSWCVGIWCTLYSYYINSVLYIVVVRRWKRASCRWRGNVLNARRTLSCQCLR